MRMVGQWKAAVTGTNDVAARMPGAVSSAVADESMLLVKTVHDGFRKQGLTKPWARLSPITIALRRHAGFRGTKALQQSGSLMRSVTAENQGPYKVFVGVNRTAKAANGKSLVDIARVHEGPYPTVIPITAKMRGFFMAMFLQGVIRAPLKRGRSVLVIMPRPFLRPAFEKVRDGFDKRMVARIAGYLGGPLGIRGF